jgi:hypothetical protein
MAVAFPAQSFAASTLIRQPSGSSGGIGYCDQQSTPECWSANGTSGDYVYTKAWNSTFHEERWTLAFANVCGGNHFVDSTCPFQFGSGLNTYYQGQPIVKFNEYYHSSLCADGYFNFAVNENPQVIQGGCASGDGYLWVENAQTIVNVKESNAAGSPGVVACEVAQDSVLDLAQASDCPGNHKYWVARTR